MGFRKCRKTSTKVFRGKHCSAIATVTATFPTMPLMLAVCYSWRKLGRGRKIGESQAAVAAAAVAVATTVHSKRISKTSRNIFSP